MKNTNIALATLLMSILVSCASTPQMIIDPASVADADQLPIDQAECTSIAQQYDLTGEIAAKSLGGGALGAVAVAGIATALSGGLFAPAIPWMVAGGTATGTLWGASASKAEIEARENILRDCMNDRGYRVYAGN